MGQFVSVDVVGTSAEGRNLSVVKICQGGCGKKPIIFIEAGDGLTVPSLEVIDITVPSSKRFDRS